MIEHEVRVHPSAADLPRADQLAWKLAALATDPVPVDDEVAEMVVNRLIDDAAVAAASLTRPPVASARAQALRHPYVPGAGLFGLRALAPGSPRSGRRGPTRWRSATSTITTPSWAPSTPIPGTTSRRSWPWPSTVIASGADLIRAVATAYEVQVDLARSISLHAHGIDHVAHLGPSVAAGLGTLLDLPTEVVFQAIGQALHTTTATRQSRKGEISSWKAYAPAFAGKVAIEAVDRAMRGERSPAPIYEGEDGVIAVLLGRSRGLLSRGPARSRRGPTRHPRAPTPRSTRPSTRRRPSSTSPAGSGAASRTSGGCAPSPSTPATTPIT